MFQDESRARPAWLALLLALTSAVVFAVFASYRIDSPGLYADEVLFVPAALEAAGECGIDADTRRSDRRRMGADVPALAGAAGARCARRSAGA